jgi:uncharacterized protein (DUF1015 family)
VSATPSSARAANGPATGLSLAPFRALRYTNVAGDLGSLLCPPYDVIDDDARENLLATNPANAVGVILPRRPSELAHGNTAPPGPATAADPYRGAAQRLADWLADGVVAVDDEAAIYVYEIRSPGTADAPAEVTRGLLGAVQLRAPEDGVILPHENTMAGPVADRLALMDATDTNLEPIYLVYDGGGAASDAVASVDRGDAAGAAPTFVTSTRTPDGLDHRLWAITDPARLSAIAEDLGTRRALIADGHHRYATYLQLAAQRDRDLGPGPWDRGLALLVDTSTYGPQVHPIHRVIPGFSFADAAELAAGPFVVTETSSIESGLDALEQADDGFAAVVTDGRHTAVIQHPSTDALAAARNPDEPPALLDLDVTVLHRVLIERAWRLTDDEHHVGYAHDVEEALAAAAATDGIAVLVRATPVAAVAAVAAAGARMPRKSTFFTPKPASGLVMRRFADQSA